MIIMEDAKYEHHMASSIASINTKICTDSYWKSATGSRIFLGLYYNA